MEQKLIENYIGDDDDDDDKAGVSGRMKRAEKKEWKWTAAIMT